MVEKFVLENNINHNISVFFITDSAMDDIGIQDTQIPLFHRDFFSLYDKSTTSAVNIIQLHIFMEVGWNGGIAGFTHDPYGIGF